jgi:subtilisin family serine protease
MDASGPVKASSEVAIGIALGPRPKRSDGRMTPEAVEARRKTVVPNAEVVELIGKLRGLGFRLTGRSKYSLSFRASTALFTKVFGGEVVCEPVTSWRGKVSPILCRIADKSRIVIPDDFSRIIGRVSIQPPVQWLSAVSASAPAPKLAGRHYVDVLTEVPDLLGVKALRRSLRGTSLAATGAGVRFTMIDSGFAHVQHPFFTSRGFMSTVTSLNGVDPTADEYGHGTGISANVFAIAPGVVFTGIRIGNESGDGSFDGAATLLEALQRALGWGADPTSEDFLPPPSFLMPQVISMSVACVSTSDIPDDELTDVEAVVEEAIEQSIVVVAAGGNLGQQANPGSSEHVISVGGAFFDEQDKLKASDFASSYTAFNGRTVPDVCGLCGPAENDEAPYIMLPVPETSYHGTQLVGSTTGAAGWALFSGTSSATPQVAAICALLLQKKPSLTPQEIKEVLIDTATDVIDGMTFGAQAAAAGFDQATGGGLVNAKRAWEAVQ